MKTELKKSYLFFKQHASYAVPPGRAACALHLAKVEQLRRHAESAGRVRFEWLPDECADGPETWGWSEKDVKRFYETSHEVTGCVLYVNGEQTESLWGIWDANADYRRIVETELLTQHLASPTGEMVQVAPNCYGPRQKQMQLNLTN